MDDVVNTGSLAGNGFGEKASANPMNNWVAPDAPKPVEAAPSRIPDSLVLPIPLNGKVLVLVDEATQQIGSILLPDTTTAPPLRGQVLRISDGIPSAMTGTLREHTVRKGDVVYFERFNGTDLMVNGLHFKLMHNDDCTSRMPRKGEDQFELFLEEREKQAFLNAEAVKRKGGPANGKNVPVPEQLRNLGLQP